MVLAEFQDVLKDVCVVQLFPIVNDVRWCEPFLGHKDISGDAQSYAKWRILRSQIDTNRPVNRKMNTFDKDCLLLWLLDNTAS